MYSSDHLGNDAQHFDMISECIDSDATVSSSHVSDLMNIDKKRPDPDMAHIEAEKITHPSSSQNHVVNQNVDLTIESDTLTSDCVTDKHVIQSVLSKPNHDTSVLSSRSVSASAKKNTIICSTPSNVFLINSNSVAVTKTVGGKPSGRHLILLNRNSLNDPGDANAANTVQLKKLFSRLEVDSTKKLDTKETNSNVGTKVITRTRKKSTSFDGGDSCKMTKPLLNCVQPSINNQKPIKKVALDPPVTVESTVRKPSLSVNDIHNTDEDPGDENSSCSSTKLTNGFNVESTAVSEAKQYFSECQKNLIEAALRQSLPQKMPLLFYSGSTLTCPECDDKFALEESFKNHEDRRCALFTYTCPDCKKMLEFYNRCTFLSHVRSHNTAVKACNLSISIIPADKLHFQVIREDVGISGDAAIVPLPGTKRILIKTVDRKRSGTKNSETTVNSNSSTPLCVTEESNWRDGDRFETSSQHSIQSLWEDDNAAASSDNDSYRGLELKFDNEISASKKNKCASPGNNKRNNTKELTLTGSEDEVEHQVSNSKNKLVTCRECKTEVENLTEHYRGDDFPKKEYPCEQCQYFNSSQCALSAHVRMHSRTQPYICPDCGYFFSTLDSFLTHVKQVCFYDFKAIRFKCPVCSVLKQTGSQFSDHIISQHTSEAFKCVTCHSLMDSKKAVEVHVSTKHPNMRVRVQEGYDCKLCTNGLISKAKLQNHIRDDHVYNSEHLRYVYICKHCKKYATSHMAKFCDHYENHCPAILVSKNTKLQLRKNKGRLNVSPRSLVRSTNRHPQQTFAVDDEDSKNTAVSRPCVICRTSISASKTTLFCVKCAPIAAVDEEAANDSSSDSSSGSCSSAVEISSTALPTNQKRKYKCKMCKTLMPRDWQLIKRHFKSHHQQSIISGSNKGRRRAANATQEASSPARKRRLLSAAGRLGLGTSAAGEEGKKRKASVSSESTCESKFKCAQCADEYYDKKQFLGHIASHKADSNAGFQCVECGLCFIVRTTLEKHLIVEHKMKERDLNDYFKENGMNAEEKEDDDKKLVENQCEVCFLECGTKANYDRHIRTHGLAFIVRQSKVKS